jgi:hypothetical protein
MDKVRAISPVADQSVVERAFYLTITVWPWHALPNFRDAAKTVPPGAVCICDLRKVRREGGPAFVALPAEALLADAYPRRSDLKVALGDFQVAVVDRRLADFVIAMLEAEVAPDLYHFPNLSRLQFSVKQEDLQTLEPTQAIDEAVRTLLASDGLYREAVPAVDELLGVVIRYVNGPDEVARLAAVGAATRDAVQSVGYLLERELQIVPGAGKAPLLVRLNEPAAEKRLSTYVPPSSLRTRERTVTITETYVDNGDQ